MVHGLRTSCHFIEDDLYYDEIVGVKDTLILLAFLPIVINYRIYRNIRDIIFTEEISENLFEPCNENDDRDNDNPCKNIHCAMIYFSIGILNLVFIFVPCTLVACLISPPISVMITY